MNIYTIIAIVISWDCSVYPRAIKAFYTLEAAENFLKTYKGSQPDEKAWEIHETELE